MVKIKITKFSAPLRTFANTSSFSYSSDLLVLHEILRIVTKAGAYQHEEEVSVRTRRVDNASVRGSVWEGANGGDNGLAPPLLGYALWFNYNLWDGVSRTRRTRRVLWFGITSPVVLYAARLRVPEMLPS